jgi:hypothetical protein
MAWIVQKQPGYWRAPVFRQQFVFAGFGLEKQDRKRTGSRSRATLILAWT